MCGLWGTVGMYLGKGNKEQVMDLAIVSSLRGIDSTGVVTVKRKKKNRMQYVMRRDLGDTLTFFNYNGKAVKDLFNGNPCVLIMGHNRAATIGNITIDNAHPFKAGSIVGAHNGTIPKLTPTAPLDQRTDSEVLINRIATLGPDKAVHDLGWDAAYAVTYYDHEKNTFNIMRNAKRTLYFMQAVDNSHFHYASEAAFLEVIRHRSMEKYKDPAPFSTDTLYTIDLKEQTCDHRKLEKEPVVAVAPRKGILGLFKPGASATTALVDEPPKRKPQAIPPAKVLTIPDFCPTATYPAGELFKTIPEGGYPERIITPDHETLFLRYRNHEGKLVSVARARQNLAGGCAISGFCADIYNKVCWVAANHYVMPEYERDDLVNSYVPESVRPLVVGEPIYAKITTIMQINTQDKERCDANAAVHARC